MSYRTKLFVWLLATAVISEGVLGALFYFQFNRTLRDALASNVRSIALTTGALLKGDKHKLIISRPDEERPEYAELQNKLRRARDANRRSDIYVKYMVTLVPSPVDPSLMQYGVDAEESIKDKSNTSDIYRPVGEPLKLGTNRVNRELITDAWGTWLSAYAPIRDSQGKVVAELEVDADADYLWRPRKRLLWQSLAALAAGLGLALVVAGFLSQEVSRPLYKLRDAIAAIGRGDLDARVEIASDDEFGEVGATVNRLAEGLREREKIKRAFAGYVSKQVMDVVLSSGDEPALASNRKRITVMFADIRNFSTMAERLHPEKVVGLLNDFFDAMIDAVIHHHGMPDKLLGDGLMAIFGAPSDDPFQEEHAVAAALEMQQRIAELQPKWQADGYGLVRVGIGINSGNAIVGNIGSKDHMEYTAVGDTVNLAARLESATRDLDVPILVSEHTYVAARPSFKWHNMGSLQVKGREDPVNAYSAEPL
jgi:adenylate cyclase